MEDRECCRDGAGKVVNSREEADSSLIEAVEVDSRDLDAVRCRSGTETKRSAEGYHGREIMMDGGSG